MIEKIKKAIFDYIKKDTYDDWIEHISMKFVFPTMILLLFCMIFYCLWAWYMGYPPPAGDVGFVQSPIIIVP